MLAEYFRMEGYDVATANDGAAGARRFQRLGVAMGRSTSSCSVNIPMDSFGSVSTFASGLPIIFLTARVGTSTRSTALPPVPTTMCSNRSRSRCSAVASPRT